MKWIASVAIATTVLFTGCGQDTNEACAFGVQQDLDTGNYDGAIAALTADATCGGEYTGEEGSLNLAAAYIGKAGLTTTNLLGSVLDSNSSNAMGSFMTSFASAATSEGLNNLDKASKLYAGIFGAAACDGTETGFSADACFYNGLVVLTKSIGTLSAVLGDALVFLTDPVVAGSINDVTNNGTADEIEVTACSIADANVPGPATCTTDGNFTFIDDVNVTFTDTVSGNQVTLLERIFTAKDNVGSLGDQNYTKLIDLNAVPPSPVTTNGLCDANYASCTTLSPGFCYPCPIFVDGNTSTVTDGLLTIINDPTSLSALTAYLPGDTNTSGDLTTSIEQVAVDNGVGTLDGNVTEAELAAYLSTL